METHIHMLNQVIRKQKRDITRLYAVITRMHEQLCSLGYDVSEVNELMYELEEMESVRSTSDMLRAESARQQEEAEEMADFIADDDDDEQEGANDGYDDLEYINDEDEDTHQP